MTGRSPTMPKRAKSHFVAMKIRQISLVHRSSTNSQVRTSPEGGPKPLSQYNVTVCDAHPRRALRFFFLRARIFLFADSPNVTVLFQPNERTRANCPPGLTSELLTFALPQTVLITDARVDTERRASLYRDHAQRQRTRKETCKHTNPMRPHREPRPAQSTRSRLKRGKAHE